MWVACSLWWELPVVVPRCIYAPVEVPIRGLVWNCSLGQNGRLVTHQTSKSSFNVSQWRICCLFLAAACLKSLFYFRAAAAECTENIWLMMDWYFISSSAILGTIWTRIATKMLHASSQPGRRPDACSCPSSASHRGVRKDRVRERAVFRSEHTYPS